MSTQTPSPAAQHEVTIGRIELKQMRAHGRGEPQGNQSANPMNRLVPYLDLFSRLADEELARLAGVGADVAATLRKQVIAIDQGLAVYTDLLPRLSDQELVRLTGATPKTIRFWRLCQPRFSSATAEGTGPEESQRAQVARSASSHAGTAPMAAAERSRPPRDPDAPRRRDKAGSDPVDPLTQRAASQMMGFSGAPFPGFDDAEMPELPDDAITLDGTDGEPF